MSQKLITVVGKVTNFYHIDSVSFLPTEYSKETYTKDGKRIYRHRPSLWEPGTFKFEKSDGDFEFVGGGTLKDSGYSTYYTDKKKSLSYYFDGRDTSIIKRLEYSGNKIIKTEYIKGGNGISYFYYRGDNLIKILTIYSDSDSSFTVFEYDKKGRQTLFKSPLKKETDTSYHFIRTDYDDTKRTKTETYGNTFDPTSYEKQTYYLDKRGIPKKMEYVFKDKGIILTSFNVLYK